MSGGDANVLRPASDAEVPLVMQLHAKERDARFPRLRSFAAGNLPKPAIEEIAIGLASFLETVFAPARVVNFRTTLSPQQMAAAGGVSQVEAVDTILGQFFPFLVAQVSDPAVLRRAQAFDQYRPELRAAVDAVREHSEAMVAQLDAAAVMQRYGRSVSKAQAALLMPLVEQERDVMRAVFRVLTDVMASEAPVDLLALLGALAEDQLEAERLNARSRAQLDALGIKAP